jgi:hypothetical protein
MAEIQQQAAGPRRGGKRRAKKMSTKIDMTPMVDLALKSNEPTDVAGKKALTIILGKDHRVHYFSGLNAPQDKTAPVPALHTTTFAPDGIRQVVLARMRQQPGLVVLIKPSAESKYQDMVNILDEMNITHQRKYALVKITQDDLTLIKTTAL